MLACPSSTRLLRANFPTADEAFQKQKEAKNAGLCHYSCSPPAAPASAPARPWRKHSVKPLTLTRRNRPKRCVWVTACQNSQASPASQPLEEKPSRSAHPPPPLLLRRRGGTYCEHGHGDAHCHEHRVGHRAALIAQLDAVVVAEEPSLVRRQGKLVQKHGNKHHCTVKQNTQRRKKKQKSMKHKRMSETGIQTA